MNISNCISFLVKVIIGCVLISYLFEITGYNHMNDFVNKLALSLFVTYGSIKLAKEIYDKSLSLLKWLTKSPVSKPFN